MIENICALEKIKKLADNSQDIIFADPPYALGSTVFIDKIDGKPKYKIAKDFMNKWDMPDHLFWEEFFKEANRVLKYGGRLLFFGIDRQLMMFQYYATMADLQTNQSLYWLFVSSFPKATDASKMIDKRLKTAREVVGFDEEKSKKMAGNCFGQNVYKDNGFNSNNMTADGACIITKSNSELGQKYDGFKYSIAPLKQNLETIMVFQKPNKHKSVLDDILAYENGDLSISPSIWSIDNSRVPTADSLNGGATSSNNAVVSKDGFDRPWMHDEEKLEAHKKKIIENVAKAETLGRYPSQLFISNEMGGELNRQSGVLKSGVPINGTTGSCNGLLMDDVESSEGGLSRFFHNIKYMDDEIDLTIYSPKVSDSERNYGLDAIESKIRTPRGNNQGVRYCITCNKTDNMTNNHDNCEGKFTYKLSKPLKNDHPTLKPIKLIYQVAKLLKSPNPQNVFFPFAGSGSEIIGFMKAGFDYNLFECSELSEDYINIANIRIESWKSVDINTFLEKKEIIKVKETNDSLKEWE